MAAEEKSNNFLILLSVGILIGAAVVYSAMKKQQLLSQAAAQASYAQAQAQQTQYLENLNSAMKRLEGKVQVQTLQPPYPPILQPLKLLAPELIESLKPLKHHVTSEAEALREMSSLMIWGLHNGA